MKLTQTHVIDAVYLAEQEQSGVDPTILKGIRDFGSAKIRHLLNNLCRFDDCNYLEVGTYEGASLFSASCGNPGTFTGIDNFSEFESPRQKFYTHYEEFKNLCNVKLIEADCWNIGPNEVKEPVNVYYYDGAHGALHQKKGLTHFYQFLADKFILLVDDYSTENALWGTLAALKELQPKVDLMIELHDKQNAEGWWEGILILLGRKK